MDVSKLRRRGALGWLGLLVSGGVLLVRGAEARPALRAGPSPARRDDAPGPQSLVGLVAGDYRVSAVGAIVHGAMALQLERADGDAFSVDVCAADDAPGAPRGPARTAHLELFVATVGQGDRPTHEAHGLAVRALARALGEREHVVPVGHLLPLRERLARHGDRLFTRPTR